jgi:hypothetical protein
MSESPEKFRRHGRGFEAAAGLVNNRIRSAGEARGFAVSRLLTHWTEVVGEEIAAMALPVKVGYGRDGFGATLTLLTTGASAPLLQMQLPAIRAKANACYGYNAISKVVITQTAPTGFAEGQVAFAPAPNPAPTLADPAIRAKAGAVSEGVHDETLRAALEALGERVLSRPRQTKG